MTPLPDWENEQLLHRNREPARASFVPFATAEQAREGKRDMSPRFRSLNGEWRFFWSPRPEGSRENFFALDFDDAAWDTLPVPANWETHGYGTPLYLSSGYPFRIDPPRVTTEPPSTYTTFHERNPTGCYRRTVEVPPEWAEQRVFLHFAGVRSAFHVWVNGLAVGYSQGSSTPGEWEITAHLRSGVNQVAVAVYKYSDGSYLEDQDMWRLGGIFREVFLYAAPPLRMRDFAVRTELDLNSGDALLRIHPTLSATAEAAATGWTIRAQLYAPDGTPVFADSLVCDAARLLNREYDATLLSKRTPQRGPARFGWLEATVPQPTLWTAETPALYRLVLTLCDAQGQVQEAIGSDVGFRTIAVQDGKLVINGRPVRLRGVNRHEWNPDTGQVLSPDDMERDIFLLKQAHVNAVRASHYPNDSRWYELCDRHGLYVMDEAEIETHGLRGLLASDPCWLPAFLDRIVRMAERDKNHACVILWSLGNESGYGPNFAAASGWLRDFDLTRPLHYEGAQDDPTDPPTIDVRGRFYPRLRQPYLNPGVTEEAIERAENARWERLLDLAENPADTRPVLASEYGHAMGNALGNLQEYWDEIYAHPQLLGGFLWEWCDLGLRRTAPDGTRFLAYGGDCGDFPNHGAFCLDGIVTADREITPKYAEVKKVYQPVSFVAVELATDAPRIRLTNRFDFLALCETHLRWELTGSGAPIQTGNLPLPACPPGETAEITIPLTGLLTDRSHTEYHLSLWLHAAVDFPGVPAGGEIAWEQFALSPPIPLSPPQTITGRVGVVEEGDLLQIEAASTTAVFSRTTGTLEHLGMMVCLGWNEPEILAMNDVTPPGPVLQAFRAPTNNDRGFGKWLARDWREAGLDRLTRTVTAFAACRKADGTVQVETAALSEGTEGAAIIVRSVWTFYGDGQIDLTCAFTFAGRLPPLPRLGIVLRLHPDLENLRWFGHGPHENYPDRKRSAALGIWESTVAARYVPYARPQENGNKEGVRWLTLTDAAGNGLRITALTEPFALSALHFTAADFADARHPHDVTQRPEVILSLDVRQCGLGNSSCGPGVLKRFAVLANREYTLALRFSPVSAPEGCTP